jgi:hypothetical protein
MYNVIAELINFYYSSVLVSYVKQALIQRTIVCLQTKRNEVKPIIQDVTKCGSS